MAFGLSAGAVTAIGMGAGALLGGSGGSSGGSSQTVDKSPWAPAQPWINSNLQTGQNLQNFYEKNPFNAQQKTGYQNLFSGVDNFNQNIAPGLMDFANKGMTGSYQRQKGGAPGSVAGYGGSVQPGGLMQATGKGPFSASPSQSYGLLDLDAQNPFGPGGIDGTQQSSQTNAQIDELRKQLDGLLAEKSDLPAWYPDIAGSVLKKLHKL